LRKVVLGGGFSIGAHTGTRFRDCDPLLPRSYNRKSPNRGPCKLHFAHKSQSNKYWGLTSRSMTRRSSMPTFLRCRIIRTLAISNSLIIELLVEIYSSLKYAEISSPICYQIPLGYAILRSQHFIILTFTPATFSYLKRAPPKLLQL
jgi:hypothetical protein